MSVDAKSLLGIYLQDHHAAAAGGRALARRCASSNEGTPLGDFLHGEFLPALDEDAEFLERTMSTVEIAPSTPKQLAVRAGEFAGRLKLNGQMTGYSPLSRVIELEALISGVQAKRRLWAAIQVVAQQHPEMSLPDTSDHGAAAQQQITRLEQHHADAVTLAFGNAASI